MAGIGNQGGAVRRSCLREIKRFVAGAYLRLLDAHARTPPARMSCVACRARQQSSHGRRLLHRPRRQVKLARADVVSAGGLTTCMTYHLIPKQESVVDSVFMADKCARRPLCSMSFLHAAASVLVTEAGPDVLQEVAEEASACT